MQVCPVSRIVAVMGKTLHTVFERLQQWLERQIEPVKWAFALNQKGGRYSDDAWAKFVSIADLPRGKRLILRPINGKKGIHVLLTGSQAQPSAELLSAQDADLYRRAKLLDSREAELRQQQAELMQRERDLNAYERRSQMEIASIQGKQDTRTSSIVSNLEAWEAAIVARESASVEMLESLSEALQRATDAESNNETAASITYAADRLVGALQMWRVKSIKDIPEDQLKQFQEYFHVRAQRRFFEHLPNGPRKWANDFMTFPQKLRDETMRQIHGALMAESSKKQQNDEGTSRDPSAPAPGPENPGSAGPAESPKGPSRPRHRAIRGGA